MTKHSPFPWFLLTGSMGYRRLLDRNGNEILRSFDCPEFKGDPNASEKEIRIQADLEKIVEYVNQMAGYTDKEELKNICLNMRGKREKSKNE